MSGTTIVQVRAREILDSRGRPTVEADVVLQNGAEGRGVSPSGASTGTNEAHELRDGDPDWYQGRGVGRAVANVNGEIASAVKGLDALDQAALDARMVQLDGSDRLDRLGANGVLAVSLAAVRAAAAAERRPLHERIAELSKSIPSMPMPMVNILSGGLHAGRGMDVQDFLIQPVGAKDYRTALHWIIKVRQTAADLMAADGLPTLLADEGGLSPGYVDSVQALDLTVRAIEAAGLRPGEDVVIALDVAATSLVDNGAYRLQRAGKTLGTAEMIELVTGWVARYPIRSIEDALGEDDWAGWKILTDKLPNIQLVGDDLFTTNPGRIAKGVAEGVANSVLIKVNQNGALSGTLEAMALARAANYAPVVSARSGETEDDFIAHLAVGSGAGQIKIGSVRNSERLAKYNTLLRLDDLYELPYAGPSGLSGLSGR
jgi:enolase